MTARAVVELRTIADELAEIPRSGMIAAAKAVKAIAREEGDRYGRITNASKKGVRLRAVDIDVRAPAGAVAIRVQGLPVGPWVWADQGTSGHPIRRRKRRPVGNTKAGRRRFDMRTMTVDHPGGSGRHVWDVVVDRADRVVPLIFDDLVEQAVR